MSTFPEHIARSRRKPQPQRPVSHWRDGKWHAGTVAACVECGGAA